MTEQLANVNVSFCKPRLKIVLLLLLLYLNCSLTGIKLLNEIGS